MRLNGPIRFLHGGIEGGEQEQDAVLWFERLHASARSQVKPADHLGGDRGAHRTASQAKPDIVPQKM